MNIVLLVCLALSNPQALITEGDALMRAEKWQEASDKYNEVLSTSRLNSIGLAMMYWNIFVAESKLSNEDEIANALLGFIVYGIDTYKSTDPLFIQWGNQFQLREKLIFSDAMVQIIWARKNNYTCRSKTFKCHLFEEEVLVLFKHEMPFCGGLKNIANQTQTYEKEILKVDVKCNVGNAETYYFVVSDEL